MFVIYFLCDLSKTKQRDASKANQKMLHRQNENVQQFALLCNVVSSIVYKQA